MKFSLMNQVNEYTVTFDDCSRTTSEKFTCLEFMLYGHSASYGEL